MLNSQVIQIVDYCERLVRRQFDLDHGRPVAFDEINYAFSDACLLIWNARYEDIDWELMPETEDFCDSYTAQIEWQKYARSRGYCLKTRSSGALVPEAEYFFYMIKAEENNALARSPEHRAKVRLQNEADRYLEERNNGVIKGF